MRATPRIANEGLSREEISVLEADHLIQRASEDGKIKASLAILGPPTQDVKPSSRRASTTATIQLIDFPAQAQLSQVFFDLPLTPYSVAGLEFIGFTTTTAAIIYQKWVRGVGFKPDSTDKPTDLIDYVYDHIGVLNTRAFHNHHSKPREAMRRLGLAEEFQEALMDERFRDMFWTESLYAWVKDTLTLRWLTMWRLLARLRRHASRKRSGERKAGAMDGTEGSRPREGSTGIHPPSTPTNATSPTTIAMTLEDHGLPSPYISILDNEPAVLPDHVALYKGKATPSQPFVSHEDGSLAMSALASSGGGDFNHAHPAYYWTPDKAVAEKYRSWAARRCPFTETWVVRIQVPNQFLEQLKVEELWLTDTETESESESESNPEPDYLLDSRPSGQDGDGALPESHNNPDDGDASRSTTSSLSPLQQDSSHQSSKHKWKEYVWHCKNKLQPPPKFKQLWHPEEGADLIVGHMFTSAAIGEPVTNIEAGEIHTKITKDHTLRLGNGTTDQGKTEVQMNGTTISDVRMHERKATQWVFMQHDKVKQLEWEIHGKVHIEITAATRAHG